MKRIIITSTILITLAVSLWVVFTVIDNDNPQEEITLSQILDSRHDQEIEQQIEKMTLEEKVGQMFMACFYSQMPSSETLKEYNTGMALLFGKCFENATINSISDAISSAKNSSKIEVLFAVDEEGGDVNRISLYSAFRGSPFKSSRELYNEGGISAIINDVHEKNSFLSKLGIKLNLAPVCDISTSPSDFMYSRSLGQNADITSEYVSQVVNACLEDNMGCCLKHFPGYGNVADTHNGFAKDNRSYEQLYDVDMKPFEAGIKAGAPSVLVSHNIVSAIDGNLPASLSPRIHRILREEMDFTGVIITDDLSMGAISDYSSASSGAVEAVLAGNDVLCTGSYKSQYAAILAAVNDGTISENRIDQSVRRILNWKRALGLDCII